MTMNQYIPAKFIKDRREDALIELAIDMGIAFEREGWQDDRPRPTPTDVRNRYEDLYGD